MAPANGEDGFPVGAGFGAGLGAGFEVDFMGNTPSKDRMIRSVGSISHTHKQLTNEFNTVMISETQIGVVWTLNLHEPF